MKTARITSITPDGDFDTANGHMWAFIVEFDDGITGQANSKKNTPPYRVGDSVGYQVTGQTPRGTNKLKIDRKFGQSAGTAPAQYPAQQANQQRQAPVQVGANDAQAFHGAMKRFALTWIHAYDYAQQVAAKIKDAGLAPLTEDQKQALVASLWIAAKDAGLAQHPPKYEGPQKATQPPPQAPQPVHRAQQQNVAEPVPANGDDDDSTVPF